MNVTLAVKPGVLCKQYALFIDGHRECLWTVEQVDLTCSLCVERKGVAAKRELIAIEKCSAIFSRVAHDVRECLSHSGATLEKIVIKISAPGSDLQCHKVIDGAYLQALQAKRFVAPTTVPQVIREVQTLQHHFPDIPVIAASDSAFHATLSPATRLYSLPAALATVHDVYRFGYDGITVSAAVRRVPAVVGYSPTNVVICHVGDTVSVTAVQREKSIDTSGGFSQASGFGVGTVGGDVDAAAFLAVQYGAELTPKDATVVIHSRCGLHGLSEEQSIASVLARATAGDETAKRALEHLVIELQKQIGAMTAVLNGFEVLVFTGPVAVQSPEFRSAVVRRLTHLGVKLSTERNEAVIGVDSVVSTRDSNTKIAVLRTDELRELVLIGEELSTTNKE